MGQIRKIGFVIMAALLLPVQSWSQEPEITVELPGGVPLEMVWIEPGTFLMGGEPDLIRQNSLHGPQHQRSGIRSGKIPNEIRPDVGFRVVGSTIVKTKVRSYS